MSNYIQKSLLQVRELAIDGDFDSTIAKFQQILEVSSDLTVEFERNTREVMASWLFDGGIKKIQQGQVQEALDIFENVQTFAPELEIPASSWNTVCWDGSLAGYEIEVQDTCEQAVKMAPENGGIRDSGGLNRALLGNFEGAIEDFEFFVKWLKEQGCYEEGGQGREAWIKALQTGENPFNEETLEALRDE